MYTVRMTNGSASANAEPRPRLEKRRLALEVGKDTGFVRFGAGAVARSTAGRAASAVPRVASVEALLERRVRAAASEKLQDWDALVEEGTAAEAPWADADAWGTMPAVDSKFAVELSPIFKEVLGCDLNVKLIRSGGYADVDDLVADLIPKAVKDAARRRHEKGRTGD